MNKRFKILKGGLKYLRTESDDANPDAPAGTPLREFQDYIRGAKNVTYTRANDSLPEELLEIAINPFYFAVNANSLTKVPISKRTKDFTGISALRNAAGITDPVPETATSLENFFPAQCTASIRDASKDDNNARSELTGVKYKKKGYRNYTFPYGATTENDREGEARAAIIAAAGADSGLQLQFTSEKI